MTVSDSRDYYLLLVDDEEALVGVLRPVLEAAGYTVLTAGTGEAALSMLAKERVDVVLLDLGLPDMDGKDVIRRMRAWSQVPTLVISARHQEGEKIAALDEGADDYVNKPFEIGELMARLRAAVRRSAVTSAPPGSFSSGPLRIDFTARQVFLGKEEVRLSPKEYDLLRTLAENAGQVVTHRRLLAAGWGTQSSDTQYLRVYIGMLRQKLEEDPADPRILLTEPGIGYRLAVV